MHWLAAWMAAEREFPTPLPVPGAPAPPPLIFNDQTVRLLVQASVGGQLWRVRLSNRGALLPLVIDAASLALATGPTTLSPRSIAALRFRGESTLTLAPGAVAWSDPVHLPADAGQRLALSFHLARPFAFSAGYPVLPDTGSSWVLPGNQVSGAHARDALPLLWGPAFTGLDVLAPQDTKLLVAFGDSITEGGGASHLDLGSYPLRLASRLRQQRPAISVVNAGIAGNRLLHAGAGESGLSRFDRDVLQQSGVSHALALIGINDIGHGTLMGKPEPAVTMPGQIVDATQIIAGLQQLQKAAQQRGVKLLLGTLLPFGGAPNWNEDNEAKREAVNRWIRNQPERQNVVDFDAALRDPAAPLRLDPRLDSGDHLHPGPAGLAAMADAVDLRLLGG